MASLKALTLLGVIMLYRLCTGTAFVTPRAAHHQNHQTEPTKLWLTLDRRGFVTTTSTGAAASLLSVLGVPQHVHAKGLVQFPLTKRLFNTYTFMRVGTTLLEEEDIISTNPLFLTSRDDALSARGQTQVQNAVQALWGSGSGASSPTIVMHSLAASSIDTANIIQQSLQMGRDRIRPEFTLLDPRGIGKFDSLTRSSTEPAIWALDVEEGDLARPPPHEDGTPNETLQDQAVRLRQLLSYLETQFSGESIVLVFPDGTGPALLSSLMAGIPLTEVHRLEFGPAEIRPNVTPDMVQTWYHSAAVSDNDAAYQQTLNRGRKTLASLRAREEDAMNRKDQKLETERLAYEEKQREQAAKQAAAKEVEEQQRQERIAAYKQSHKRAAPSSEKSSILSPAGPFNTFPFQILGGMVVAQLFRPTNRKEETASSSTSASVSDHSTSMKPAYANTSTARSMTPSATTNVTEVESSSFSSSLFEEKETEETSDLNGNDDLVIPSLNKESRTAATPLSEVVDKQALADQAMTEYLEKDDGGDAWLSSIVDILQDNDEDEDL